MLYKCEATPPVANESTGQLAQAGRAETTAVRCALIAHTDEAVRNGIKQILIPAGAFRVIGACDGRQTIARLGTHLFDCLVVADQLGDVDAWRIVRIVRSGRFCTASLPIAVLVEDSPHGALEGLAGEYGVYVLPSKDLGELPGIVDRLIGDHAATKPTVLIIEDNVAAAEVARQALATSYRVEIAHDGAIGLDAWRKRRHDLVLLDLQLPDLSGREVLNSIHGEDPAQTVIVITAYAGEYRPHDLMLAGAAEFLDKPINPQALRHRCEQILRDGLDLKRYQTQREEDKKRQSAGRHLWAAQHYLESGQTGLAGAHLKHARALSRPGYPTEDEWAELLSQFE